MLRPLSAPNCQALVLDHSFTDCFEFFDFLKFPSIENLHIRDVDSLETLFKVRRPVLNWNQTEQANKPKQPY
jgi:hypothetical protein